MSELVVLNGAGNIARSIVLQHLRAHPGKYASLKLVDARPYRSSVYNFQTKVPEGIHLGKFLARNAQSVDLTLHGAQNVLYVTHDYFTMSSDKNTHLQLAAKLTKKHGVSNFVAVCPFEQDLAWSEEENKSFRQIADEGEQAALQTNPNMTLLKTNLMFGPRSHLIRFLTQCAIIGKSPYKNLTSADQYLYAPIFRDDIERAVSHALDSNDCKGIYNLCGSEELNLKTIMNSIETYVGKDPGSTAGPLLPFNPLDFAYDWMYGTGSDVNMSRMVQFYEGNPELSEIHCKNTWAEATGQQPATSFSAYYESLGVKEELDLGSPTMFSYKLQHTD